MKKINIVKESKDFETAIKKGTLKKNKHFILYYIDTEHKNYRFGLSVGKKIGNAVVRNKTKRKLKSIVDNNINYYQNGRDYIIIVKRSCLELSFQDLEQSFIHIIKQTKKEN